jgi:nicotinamide riboside kinase
VLPRAEPSPGAGVIIAVVGAESTGKSTLAQALAAELAKATGWSTTWVPEVLRAWCEQQQRTPRADEQAGIAQEQARRIEAAATQYELVVADTTPLMTAVYHRLVFGDRSLDAAALHWQRRCTVTLLTALDLPWVADGLQRDGAHVREPVDNTLRDLLMGDAQAFTVVSGQQRARVEAALAAVTPQLLQRAAPRPGLFSRLMARQNALPAWISSCETCDVPDCEHALKARANGTPPRR